MNKTSKEERRAKIAGTPSFTGLQPQGFTVVKA